MPGIKVYEIEPCQQIVSDLAEKIRANAVLLGATGPDVLPIAAFESNAKRYLQWAIAFKEEFLAAIEHSLNDVED